MCGITRPVPERKDTAQCVAFKPMGFDKCMNQTLGAGPVHRASPRNIGNSQFRRFRPEHLKNGKCLLQRGNTGPVIEPF